MDWINPLIGIKKILKIILIIVNTKRGLYYENEFNS